MLVPGAVRGDTGFGNFATFGGSSVAENRYTFNGLNITDPNDGFSFAHVPFEGLAEIQVMNGGLDAAYGGGTGGLVNLVPTWGINEFHAGASIYWEPASLRETNPDQFDGFGTRLANNQRDKGWEYTTNLWSSGALVEDRLFAYALLSRSGSQDDRFPGSGGNNQRSRSAPLNWLVKLDWYIADGHELDFSAFSDRRDLDNDYYGTSFANDLLPNRGAYLGTTTGRLGGESNVLNYSGRLTDDFKLSLLAGTSQFASGFGTVSASGLRDEYIRADGSRTGGCPVICDGRSGIDEPVTGCSFVGFVGLRDGGAKRDQYGLSGEWRLGPHRLTGGVDRDQSWAQWGVSTEGGEYWFYFRGADDTNIAAQLIDQLFGRGEATQTGVYLQDQWQVTEAFSARIGLRWQRDRYATKAGELFEAGDTLLPRLGFDWHPGGDHSLTVFGTVGRFSTPLPAATVARATSYTFSEDHYFTFTEVDPVTGVPLDPVPLIGTLPLPDDSRITVDPRIVASQNLKPILQDELTLGFRKVLGNHVALGARAIYRNLKRTISTNCDYRPIVEVAPEVDGNDLTTCRLTNPGADAVFLIDTNGDGNLETVRIGADEVWQVGNLQGVPAGTRKLPGKAARTYRAIELFAEGRWDRLWLQGSYVWSKSRGNAELGVGPQGGEAFFLNPGFYYPEQLGGASGYLSNDRRHTLKLFGGFDISEQWSMGGNLLVQSGRPGICLSYSNGAVVSPPAGFYFYCGDVVDRGAASRTPWLRTVDLNIRYAPSFADGDLRFQIDVFNLFNERTPIEVSEYSGSAYGDPQAGDLTNPNAPRPFRFGQATDWQAPRSVQFSVPYEF